MGDWSGRAEANSAWAVENLEIKRVPQEGVVISHTMRQHCYPICSHAKPVVTSGNLCRFLVNPPPQAPAPCWAICSSAMSAKPALANIFWLLPPLAGYAKTAPVHAQLLHSPAACRCTPCALAQDRTYVATGVVCSVAAGHVAASAAWVPECLPQCAAAGATVIERLGCASSLSCFCATKMRPSDTG